MNQELDTPETDAECANNFNGLPRVEFAQKLERERNALAVAYTLLLTTPQSASVVAARNTPTQ